MKPTVAPGGGIVLDIDAELDYWRRVLPTSELANGCLPFDALVPTIKFGYDCYLLRNGQPLAEVLPILRPKYLQTVSVNDQLDWLWADQIIRHAWGRMSGR